MQALADALGGEREAIEAARKVPSTLTLAPAVYGERIAKLGEVLRLPQKVTYNT